MCLNAAILGFDHCASHIVDDKDFATQPFLGRCTHVAHGVQCAVPCPPSVSLCRCHLKLSRKGRKRDD
jgi:hypothetical protein